jgi:hypothetical protein
VVSEPAMLVRSTGFGFLERSLFCLENPSKTPWISLDFLGFSRPNRAFSMGYTGKTAQDFSSPFSAGVSRPRTGTRQS